MLGSSRLRNISKLSRPLFERRSFQSATQVPSSQKWLKIAGAFAAGTAMVHWLTQSSNQTFQAETDRGDDVPPAGDDKSTKQKLLSHGAHAIQNFAPLQSIHQYVCGLHFYSGELQRQVVAHHYCHHLNADMHQCVIYDGNDKNSKLIGVEYIISEKLFDALPDEERKYWHSHNYEVKSGMLIAPRVPTAVENEVMKDLVRTYGKTIHTWQVDRGDVLPLGPPQLMMAPLADEHVDQRLLQQRDRDMGLNTEEKRKARAHIPPAEHLRGADNWAATGRAVEFIPKEVPLRSRR
eukprot:GILJ01011448.1.p1 GENE.GILJ01011448.1~~GILJ01011448.1.p1  ORF type:complete len:293 (+),score=34.51 GILJ01011448.1:143-1021(+)